MRRKVGGHGPRRSVWTVITGGPHPMATTFRSQARAERFASNIQGAKVSGPGSSSGRFWTFKRILVAIVVVVLVVVFLF